jgi:predicted phosphodiesterase
MRYLVLSDVHANLEALEAVLALPLHWGQVIVLGDLVGYGADPNAVVERVRTLPLAAVVRGNHDKVAAGLAPVESFNPVARQAIQWTAQVLTAENRAWLTTMPPGPAPAADGVEICHGAPFDEDFYVFDELDAQKAAGSVTRALCLFGHTHVPGIFRLGDVITYQRVATRVDGFVLRYLEGERRLVNCGAVSGRALVASPEASAVRRR